jgi:hypothetical protein
MQKILAVLLCFVVFFSACTCTTIGNKFYQNCYGNITPCTNSTYYLGYYRFLDEWNDLAISGANVKLPASQSPTFTAYKGTELPAFSPTQTNIIYFTAQLPHSYNEGSDLEFHLHLAYPNASTGNSTWLFTYSWANINSTFPTESNSGLVHVVSPAVTDKHQLAEIMPTISGTGKLISSILLCSVSRIGGDVGDTYPGDIYLVSMDFHYRQNTLGSKTELTK